MLDCTVFISNSNSARRNDPQGGSTRGLRVATTPTPVTGGRRKFRKKSHRHRVSYSLRSPAALIARITHKKTTATGGSRSVLPIGSSHSDSKFTFADIFPDELENSISSEVMGQNPTISEDRAGSEVNVSAVQVQMHGDLGGKRWRFPTQAWAHLTGLKEDKVGTGTGTGTGTETTEVLPKGLSGFLSKGGSFARSRQFSVGDFAEESRSATLGMSNAYSEEVMATRAELLLPEEVKNQVIRGKITQAAVKKAIGPEVLEDIKRYLSLGDPSSHTSMLGGTSLEDASQSRKTTNSSSTHNLGSSPKQDDSVKEGVVELKGSTLQSLTAGQSRLLAEAAGVAAFEKLCGTGDSPGSIQVVVSGPAGFVYHMEGILLKIGVPVDAMVLLD